jgi:hypothetical protein
MRETIYLLDTLQLQESVLTGRYGISLGMISAILVLDFPFRVPQGQGRSATNHFYRLGTIFQSVTFFLNGTRMHPEFFPSPKSHRIFFSVPAVG